jgi:hypothetical protein
VFRRMDDLRNAPLEAGKVHELREPYERVLKATRKAVVDAGLTIKEITAVSETQTNILAERGMSALSWGELVRVIVQESGEGLTVVKILTMRRIAMNIAQRRKDPCRSRFHSWYSGLGTGPLSPRPLSVGLHTLGDCAIVIQSGVTLRLARPGVGGERRAGPSQRPHVGATLFEQHHLAACLASCCF